MYKRYIKQIKLRESMYTATLNLQLNILSSWFVSLKINVSNVNERFIYMGQIFSFELFVSCIYPYKTCTREAVYNYATIASFSHMYGYRHGL